MSIYLTRIQIDKLFGYRDIDWHVNQDVNILGGVNGSGKSTIFHICSDLLGWGYVSSRFAKKVGAVRLTFNNGFLLEWDRLVVKSSIKNARGYFYRSIDDGKINADGSQELQRIGLKDADGQLIPPSVIVDQVPTDFLSSFDQVIRDNQESGQKGDPKSNDRTYLDLLLTDGIFQRNSKITQILYDSFLNTTHNQQSGDDSHQVSISPKNTQYILLFNKVIMDFFSENYKVKTGTESSITFISKETGKEIPYQDLSLGEKEMLLLILRISNTYDQPVIVWLDEPDLGLHVDWQVKLVNSLRELNPNIQLFVSTHAPSMVEGNFNKVKEMKDITVR